MIRLDKYKLFNIGLLSIFIAGSVFALIVDPLENDVISIFLCLIFTTAVTLFPSIKACENQKKTAKEYIRIKTSTKVLMSGFLSLLIFGTAYNIITFIVGVINRANNGIVLFTRITFWFGILWALFMSGIIIDGVINKRHVFLSKYFRRYVYAYLNIFMGLMIILK